MFFFLLFWGLTLTKLTWQTTKVVTYSHTTNQYKHCDHVIHACIANEHKTKDVQGQGPSNINRCLFVCLFDVYQHS